MSFGFNGNIFSDEYTKTHNSEFTVKSGPILESIAHYFAVSLLADITEVL